MRNVTITLDEETARWARIEAAKRDVSLSRLIRDLLQQRMSVENQRQAAIDRFLARDPLPFKSGRRYPTRDELYDRAGFR
jgi:hypothetical protein